jgi:hypothetical protein
VIGGGPANKNSNPFIYNSILWGDIAGGGNDEITSDGAGVTTITDSIVENGCQPVSSTCTNIITTNPNLGALLLNAPGLTTTRAIGVGSSALDAGGINVACATTDQRGIIRPQGVACDIGAFEAEFLPVIQFSQMNYTSNEEVDTNQSIILVRTANLTMTAQVQVSLSGGTASSGTDYSNAGFPKTLAFGGGVVSQTVPISLIDDALVEPTETISLTVAGLSNAVIGAQNSAVLQIEDNDAVPSPTIYLPLIIK